MSRRLKAPFKSYEGAKEKDKHIRLTKDMLNSSNFKSLKNSSKILYMYMKLWACGKEEFTYSISLGTNILSQATVIAAIRELIQKGFIERTYFSNGGGHKANGYKFSNRWQYYNAHNEGLAW